MAEGSPSGVSVVRLGEADGPLARATFALMGEVFEEAGEPPGPEHVARLLARPDFWAYAAIEGSRPVGGLTAFVLSLTRTEASELFVHDIAVDPQRQRRGVGRALLTRLLADGAAAGIDELWVPAEDEDTHALDFYRSTGGTPQAVTVFTYRTG